MGEKVMSLLVLAVVVASCVAVEVHKVGEPAGWTTTNIAPNFYKSWAASKVFHVGDTILFEYNKEFHNVVRVTHNNFNACNATSPYGAWATGNDSFTIPRPGHYYFICGFPGHCWAGQRVDVRVLQSPGSSPSPCSPPEVGPTSGPSPISASPAHPPKKSASSSSLHLHLKLRLCVVGLGLIAVAF